MTDMFSLAGKNAIVTGAARKTGLCCQMAQAFNEAGAEVLLFDVSAGVFELARELGGEEAGYYAVQADLTDEESLTSGFEKAVKIFHGRVDILLNGAGLQYRAPAEEFPRDKWEKIISINLSAMFYMSQLAAKNMMQRGWGRIINIASMTSFCGSRNIPAYTASKGGVMQLTKALSNEWAGKGINVNAIAPGYMNTELSADVKKTELGKLHTARIPKGYWGDPKELKGPAVFLASEASSYITGAILPVDGGYLGF